ncbi:MAG TPA: MarR family winged helix-turn-helix transcriptional regulator [Gaiellaceae bacterium]|nr:MarR family winged helix-turn-helix transcriptional regulator [Gaiellaceae bacterium]
MSSEGPTILLDVFLTNQRRKQMIEAALAQTAVPAADYPLYVLVGAEGPWTPTGLARRLEMPLSTMLFRLGRLERRGHSERVRNPDDGRSYLIRLTDEGERLLGDARPAFRDYALAVEGRLGAERVDELRAALEELRDAVSAELESRAPLPETQRG